MFLQFAASSASQGGSAAVRLLSSLARVLTGGTSSPWPPHIGASSALALSAPRRRLTALLVLGMLLVPLRRSALLIAAAARQDLMQLTWVVERHGSLGGTVVGDDSHFSDATGVRSSPGRHVCSSLCERG